jgi:hypothetical protein
LEAGVASVCSVSASSGPRFVASRSSSMIVTVVSVVFHFEAIQNFLLKYERVEVIGTSMRMSDHGF